MNVLKQKKGNPLNCADCLSFSGGPPGTRTPDQLIKSYPVPLYAIDIIANSPPLID